MRDILFYDFEVFRSNWFMVGIDTDGDVCRISDDVATLKSVYEKYQDDIWVGYNSRRYDQYILKGILLGLNPKEINDFIIGGNDGWKFGKFDRQLERLPLLNYDVAQITDAGLKALEGMMGNDIRETTVPFDIDRPLTDEEKAEVFFYCEHDVRQTMEVFKRRVDDFNTVRYFIEHFGLQVDAYNKTKAQLAAAILGGNRRGKRLRDEFDFQLLDCIQLSKYKFVADWYRDKSNQDYNKRQSDIMVAGVPHTFAWGGGHGALEKFHADGVFLNIDVTSYYPSLQIKYLFGQRVMDAWENFEFIHNSNLQFKAEGDKKKRQPFKIMDNAISGQLKQPTSSIYDPRSNNEICINGQLLLLDLIEHLEPHCKLIQNNTDGVIVQIDDVDKRAEIEAVVSEWEARTGMHMEIETFTGTIYQKDVNNYFLIDRGSGKVKSKGAYVMPLSDLKYELAVVNKAIRAYMTDGTPVEDTILNCNTLKDFQLIARIGAKWAYLQHGDDRLKERCVRVFASNDATDSGVFKVKTAGGKPNKFQNSPSHCFIDNSDVNTSPIPERLDKDWYIGLAHKRLADFGCSDVPIPAHAVRVKKEPESSIYKGVIPVIEGTKSAPAMSYKDRTDFPNKEDLKYEQGLVAPLKDDVVLIDVDDREQAERLLGIVKQHAPECAVIRTTRGLHFLFLNNGALNKAETGTYLAVGIKADIKLGDKNGLEVIRQDGIDREVIHGKEFLTAVPQRVPEWLMPMTGKGAELAATLLNLPEGVRNDTLFRYAIELRRSLFSNASVRETIELINSSMLAQPLPDTEVNQILRSYDSDNSDLTPHALFFRKPGGFMHADFGDMFARTYHAVRFRHDAYIYDEKTGVYSCTKEVLFGKMHEDFHNIRVSQKQEVREYLKVSSTVPTITDVADANLIAFQNGVYDLDGDLFRPFSPACFIRSKLPWNYNPKAKSAVVDKFLDDVTCGNPDVLACLLEMQGYCLYKRSSLGKAFVLLGDKSNGKSTYLHALATFLGHENISSLDIKNLGARFQTAELYDKLANIGDDIGEDFIPDPSTFKKLVTGELISAERKGQDPFQFNNYATLVFSANSVPRIKDRTGAVQRRLCIIPFDREFSPGDEGYDPNLKEKLTTPEAMEYFGKLAIEGLKRLLKQKKFTESKRMEEELTAYNESNNPILEFFEQFADEPNGGMDGRSTSDVYSEYKLWCAEDGLKPLAKQEFSRQLCKRFLLESKPSRVDGQPQRIYVPKQTNTGDDIPF